MEKISFSNYDIYEKLLSIADKHIESGTNSDFLRTGLFGYVTEAMANTIRDNALEKTFLYNEGFLNTAVIPNSIYNYAKMFNVEVPTARPSRATVNIIIPYSDFIQYRTSYAAGEYGLTDPETNILILDRNGGIVVGEYRFNIEKSIKVYEKENGTVGAEYILTEPIESDFAAGDVYSGSNYYALHKNISVTIENNNIILHNVRMYQFERNVKEIQITTNNVIENKVQKIEFNNYFAGVDLQYTFSNKTEDI
jgi:hypothetical protein